MMEHQQARELLPAYVDQELGLGETIQIERHLNDCAECQQDYAQQSQLSSQLKNPAFYFEAPADLAQRINTALLKERATPASASASSTAAAARPRRWYTNWQRNWQLSWLNVGALLTTLLAVFWSVGMYLTLPTSQDQLANEVVASHVRSLQVDHLSDVVSSDHHTVKPWFNGKLNFSPPVVELATQGYPLIGGRLDYLDGKPVAALIYHRQLHPINLYIWPTSSGDTTPMTESRRGYHLAHWTTGGMTYWVASDVAATELASFVTLLRAELNQNE